jgi:hypothetical protein
VAAQQSVTATTDQRGGLNNGGRCFLQDPLARLCLDWV